MPVSAAPRQVSAPRGPFEVFVRAQSRLGNVLTISELWLLRELCRVGNRHGLVSGKSFAYFAAIKGQSREWIRRLFRRLESVGLAYRVGPHIYVRLSDVLASGASGLDQVRAKLREARALIGRRIFAAVNVNSELTIKKPRKETEAMRLDKVDLSDPWAVLEAAEPGSELYRLALAECAKGSIDPR